MRSRKSTVIGLLILVIALLFVYAPILILAVYSFTDSTMIGKGGSFSMQNYVKLFTTPELASMIWGTIFLALFVSVIATILGTVGAIGVFHTKHRAQGPIKAVNQIPVINADVVTGFSICILVVVVLGVSKDTYLPLIIGLVTLCTPFVFLSVLPKLGQMDPSLYEAAVDLGATPMTALWKVILPEILPGVLSGFSMAVTLCLDDYFITTYTKPATFDTISTYVVNATRGSQTDIKTALWALSTVIFLIVLCVAFICNRTQRRAGMKKTAGIGGDEV